MRRGECVGVADEEITAKRACRYLSIGSCAVDELKTELIKSVGRERADDAWPGVVTLFFELTESFKDLRLFRIEVYSESTRVWRYSARLWSLE
jgi:hypothetical protein